MFKTFLHHFVIVKGFSSYTIVLSLMHAFTICYRSFRFQEGEETGIKFYKGCVKTCGYWSDGRNVMRWEIYEALQRGRVKT